MGRYVLTSMRVLPSGSASGTRRVGRPAIPTILSNPGLGFRPIGNSMRKFFCIVSLMIFGLSQQVCAQSEFRRLSETNNHQPQRVRRALYQQQTVMSDILGDPFSDEPAGSGASSVVENAPPIDPPPEVDPIMSIVPAPDFGSPVVLTEPICEVAEPTCGAPGCASSGCDCDSSVCGSGLGSGCGPAGQTATSCSQGCADGCSGGCGGVLGICECDLGEAWSLNRVLYGTCPPCVSIGGWLSMGYHSADNGLFNSRPDQFAMHQGWLYAEKAADASSPLGFRVDLMYGLDANDTQAFGNPAGSWDYLNGFDHGAYGWAIPQAYVDLALGNWNITAGHFYTLIGYEVVTAPDNFFYSHSMTMYNSEPFTHTGVLATGDYGDVTLYAGWTLGWDTGFDQLNDGSSWLGGFGIPLGEDTSFTYISTAGNFGSRGDDAYSHSIVLDVTMTDKLNWVAQSDVVRVASTGEDNVGINQYFLYSVNDCLGIGARVEWWKGDVLTNYLPHGGVSPASGSYSNYAATIGANVRPHANLVIRPELRLDWSPAADYDHSYFGIDAVFVF